jgi:hypothetical protein
MLTRGGVTIDYGTIETLNLNAGTGTDTINVTTTAGSVNTNIATTAGGDTVNVTNTGTSSNVTITGDVGANAITVATTGANSVMVVTAGAGDDVLTQNANGNASGIAWNGEAGDDTIAVKTSAVASATRVDGGADNDLVELGNGTLAAIQGATSLIGGSNRAAVTVDVFQVTNVGTTLSTTPTSVETGDRLRLRDASGTGGVSYVVSPARITRATLAPSVLYSTFEQMDLDAGSGSDYISLLKRVDVNPETLAVVDSLPSIMRVDGGTGLSNFVSYRNEAGADNVVLGSTGVTTVNSATAEATLQLANVQRAEAIGNGTENKYFNVSPVRSLLYGDAGNDQLCTTRSFTIGGGSAETDVLNNGDILIGGQGADIICLRSGVDPVSGKTSGAIAIAGYELNTTTNTFTPVVNNPTVTIESGSVRDLIYVNGPANIISNSECGTVSINGVVWVNAVCWLTVRFDLSGGGSGGLNPQLPSIVDDFRKPPVAGEAEGEYPFHNRLNALDVDDDGQITPTDALLVINQLNSKGSGSLIPGGEGEASPAKAKMFVDTNADNLITALDALLVINTLNGRKGRGEGESGSAIVPAASISLSGANVTVVDGTRVVVPAGNASTYKQPQVANNRDIQREAVFASLADPSFTKPSLPTNGSDSQDSDDATGLEELLDGLAQELQQRYSR